MSHNIDTSNGQDNVAYLGSRNDVWHNLGQEMLSGMSTDEWRKAAGLDWHAELRQGFAAMPDGSMLEAPYMFNVRSDTKHVLGVSTDRYQNVQPKDILDWFEQYISVDDRFQLDAAGSLKKGELIWATAKFNGPVSVAGDTHVARLLMTTSFDGSMATINRATMVRVICNNTLDASLADRKKSLVKTRHNTKFDPKAVGAELSRVIQGFENYKAMGDAMAQRHLDDKQLFNFFRHVLGIGEEIKTTDDLSTRKENQLKDLIGAYKVTAGETEPGTAWCALNAVTRYVDHNRSTRDTDGVGEAESRFVAAQFGSGAQLKERAVTYLTDADLLKAVAAIQPTRAQRDDNADMSAFLSQPFRPSKAN